MGFSEQYHDLVSIMEAVGEIAIGIHSDQIMQEERWVKELYIDSLIKSYFDHYRNTHNTIPSKSLFAEAINCYLAKNFKDKPLSLSKTIKDMMRKLVFKPYNQYRREHYRPTPNLAIGLS